MQEEPKATKEQEENFQITLSVTPRYLNNRQPASRQNTSRQVISRQTLNNVYILPAGVMAVAIAKQSKKGTQSPISYMKIVSYPNARSYGAISITSPFQEVGYACSKINMAMSLGCKVQMSLHNQSLVISITPSDDSRAKILADFWKLFDSKDCKR